MSRLRTIKPGFFLDEGLAECSPLARLLFAGLWTISDRDGRLEDRPKRIKVECLPYDDCDVDALLWELSQPGFIIRYEAAGARFIAIPTWHKHQSPHTREAASTIPAPDKHSTSTVPAPDKPLPSCLGSCLGSCLVSCHGSGEEQEHTSDSSKSNESDEAPDESIEMALVALDDFEDFWAAYPRRENKKKANTAWSRLNRDQKRLAIGVASIMTDLVAKGVTELRFVPLPTTFIHGHRWEDWRDGIPASWCEASGNGKADAARAEHDAFLRRFAADRGLDYEPGEP